MTLENILKNECINCKKQKSIKIEWLPKEHKALFCCSNETCSFHATVHKAKITKDVAMVLISNMVASH